MKTKLLFTAALMSAAALYSEQAIGENTMRYLNAVNTSEVVMTAEVNEQQESGVDISKWVLWNSKMETLASWDQCGWLTDVEGGNFRTYTMPTDADINKGECPYPNAVERWQGAELKYAANTNILYQKINVPNGDYTVTMWAESQDLGDHTHKGGMFVFANEEQQDITNHCTLQQYTLQVTVTDGTLTLGVKTGENGSDDNHVVMAAVTILADQNIIDGISTDNPLDVTGAVKNSSCVAGFGWSKNTLNASASYNVNNSALDSEDYKGIGIEYWTGSNNPTKNADLIYQEIYNLPAGKYKVSAVAMGRNQGGGDVCEEGLYLFANDGESTVTTNVWGKVTVEGIVLADGILRVGLRAGENNGNNWLAISQVEVEFVGEDLTAMATALEQKVTEAHNLANELTDLVPTSYITRLNEVTNKTCSTSEEYLEAISEIDKLITDVNEAKAIFNSSYLSVQNYAEYLSEALKADESAKSKLNETVASNKEVAFASEDQSVWKEAGNSILEACKVFYESSDGFVEGVSNLDVTPLMVANAGFDDKTMDGWNCTYTPNLDYGMPFFDFTQWWQPTFDFYQEVNVPNGLYNVSVQEHATIGDKTDLYIQSSEARMTAKMNWNHGGTVEQAAKDWENDKDRNRATTGNVLVVDGKVRIGVNVHIGFNGQLFYDNFRLTMVSDGAAEIQNLYDTKLKEARSISQDNLTEAFKTKLTNAINMPATTLEEKYSAYVALKEAVSECGLAGNYLVSIPQLIESANECLDNSEASKTLKENLKLAVSVAGGYRELATGNELRDCYTQLETALHDYMKVADPVGEYQFDMTFLLTNPDLTNLPAWSQQAGWYTDTDKTIQCMHNSEVVSEDGKDAFYEIYAGSRTPMPEGNILYQKTVLTPGSYLMTAYAYGKGVNDNYTGNLSGNLFAGETKGDAVTAEKLTQGSVKFVQSNEQEIKLGLYSDGTGTANWAGIGYMKLYKVAPTTLSLSEENTSLGIDSDTYGNVTVDRTLKKADSWNTFCVPFAMTAEQLAANKITEVRKLENTVENGGSVVLNFSEPVTEIEAGVPYIVKVGEAVSQITVNGVAVKVAEPAPLEVGSVNMLGNYGQMSITGDQYFISDNKFYRAADKKVTVKGFRAYITLDEVMVGVNQMLINIDGNVTAIEDVLGEDVDTTVNVYTIDGVCVKSGVKSSEALDGLRKGIYIVNGKKVVK